MIPTNYNPAAEATSKPEAAKPRVLSLKNRCDRCGAQAFVRVALKSGGELDFCGHHFAEHEAALVPHVLSLTDEREFINQKGGAST